MGKTTKLLAAFCGFSLLALGALDIQAKTLVYCSEASPEGFNPAFYTGGNTLDATSKNLFNKLVEFERGTTTLIPGVAEAWEMSADGKEYTFHLRKGVKFHTTKIFAPTRELNADDVIFSFMRQLDPKNPFYKVSNGTYVYFNDMGMPDLIKEIVKVDDHTVKFILKSKHVTMLADIAMDFASIQSKEYADKMMAAGTPEVIDQEPVGTGPFQFVSYQKDAVIRYKANPDYWMGKAPIDDLVFAITPDASVRYQKLKAGECHVMAMPNPADIAAMAKDPEVNLMQLEGLNVGYLAYNTMQKPFDNPKVRKALNMAMNKKAIIDAVFQGAGKVAKNPLPPTIWSYNDKVVDDPYDPAAAKKMLDEAGVKGLKMKVWAMPVSRPYNPNARRMAELIQADWAKVGVKVEIVSYEWAEYLKSGQAKDHDGAILLGWTGDNGDPDNFLATNTSCESVGGNNYAEWCYKPFEDLIQKAKVVSDQAERTKLYEQAQVIFKEQAPWATISHSLVSEPLRKEVVNYKIDPLGGHIFYGVDLK
ncbi:MAG: ABC transporter substrate-binding protein [Desulfoprunum sp.]|nr:ABC transporter substrate-binding protein [Desulfoprunum sp.]